MTDIICSWLNNDIKLSQRIDPESLGQIFSNGYLFGEILNKHGIQTDFDQFSQNKTSNSKLNNFVRLQPSLNLLQIKFNTKIAREIMEEKNATINRLLYQLYIALTNKEKRNLTGAAMETMRPAAPVKLEQFEAKIYQKSLTEKTPRQTELNLDSLRARYDKFKQEQEKIAFQLKIMEQEQERAEQQLKRSYLINRSREYRQKQIELFDRINDNIKKDENFYRYKAADVHIPKTPPQFKKEAIIERRRLYEKDEGERALKEIDLFERKLNKTANFSQFQKFSIVDMEEMRDYEDIAQQQQQRFGVEPVEFIQTMNNTSDFIVRIRNRLQEDTQARKEREKRRRKVLVDQLRATEALEELKREEALVARLLRQSQFERRVAAELLHARHEKEIIRENRIAKERDILEKREVELMEALDRERELARLNRIEYMEQVRKDKEWHDLIEADKQAAKYKKHYEMCGEIVGQIFEFASKVAEYRELTDDELIPPKLWRHWVHLFVAGRPINPHRDDNEATKTTIEKALNVDTCGLDEDSLKLLDECDFIEYKNVIGEWEIEHKYETETLIDDMENKIVGHIVAKLHEICYPPEPAPPKPDLPEHTLKVCLLGKPFTYKTNALKMVQQISGIHVLYPQELISEAIDEFKRNPTFESPESNESTGRVRKLGEQAMESLKNGNPIADEIIVDVLVERIKSLDTEHGWIIDGFPTTFKQAKLLEKALTGCDVDAPVDVDRRTKMESVLAPDPKPRPDKPKYQSGIDLIVYLDANDDMVIKRSVGRLTGNISNHIYHVEFNPPPEGSHTGLNHVEMIAQTKDDSNDMEQLHNRLNAFDNEWKLMRQFYEEHSHLSSIALSEKENVTDVAQKIQTHIDEFVTLREKKRLDELEKKRILENLLIQKQNEEAEELLRKAEAVAREKEAKEAEALKQAEEAKKALEAQESS